MHDFERDYYRAKAVIRRYKVIRDSMLRRVLKSKYYNKIMAKIVGEGFVYVSLLNSDPLIIYTGGENV